MSGAAAPAPQDRGRKSELSWLNLAFCFLVVWIHCASQAVTRLDHESWQFALLYSAQRLSFVAFYGFFFLSGLKLTLPRARTRTLPAYWRSRAKAILFPYCLSVLVYYLVFTLHLHYFPFSLRELLGYMLRGDLAAHYYFLIALFQFILLAPLFLWLSRRWSPTLLLPLALVLNLLCLQHLPDILGLFWPDWSFSYNGISFTSYLFYYLAGCFAGQQYDRFLQLVKQNLGLLLAVCTVSGAFTAYLFWLSATNRYYSPFLDQVQALYICTGVPLCCLLALRLPKRIPPLLVKLDRAAYLIYLYHCLTLNLIDIRLSLLGVTRISQLLVLRTLAAFLITPVICVLWQELVQLVKRTVISTASKK